MPSGGCQRNLLMIVDIGSGNGLVPSGNKPLPEPRLTHSVLCRHVASLGPNKLTYNYLENHGCVFSTAATDALVLKHQAISIHNAD